MKPALRDIRVLQRRPHADHRDEAEQHHRQRPYHAMQAALQIAFGLRDQPAAAEQRISDDEPKSREQAERREPAEGVAGITAVDHRDALQERAQCDATEERRARRTADEREVPHRFRAIGLGANSNETPRKIRHTSMKISGR